MGRDEENSVLPPPRTPPGGGGATPPGKYCMLVGPWTTVVVVVPASPCPPTVTPPPLAAAPPAGPAPPVGCANATVACVTGSTRPSAVATGATGSLLLERITTVIESPSGRAARPRHHPAPRTGPFSPDVRSLPAQCAALLARRSGCVRTGKSRATGSQGAIPGRSDRRPRAHRRRGRS